jgi:hypothetical protein
VQILVILEEAEVVLVTKVLEQVLVGSAAEVTVLLAVAMVPVDQ